MLSIDAKLIEARQEFEVHGQTQTHFRQFDPGWPRVIGAELHLCPTRNQPRAGNVVVQNRAWRNDYACVPRRMTA